tara:strand:- start:129 stop:680 length:552 start_codon:yes stop_codon:yes gene_type:complete
MKKLIDAIYLSIPEVIKEWNENKLTQLESLVEQPFKEYFNNRQTQEKTKMVSPVIDTIFTRIMKTHLNDFEVDEGKGRDYKWGNILLESKLTLGEGNSWTGNGYTKTDIHLLFRFNIDENGIIVSYFSSVVDLSKCESNWTSPTNKSNFSTLKFLTNDISEISIIHGEMVSKKKYLSCEMIKA